MKSNSKNVVSKIQAHIIGAVYDYEKNCFDSLKKAANHLNNEFERVANYPTNLKRFPNNQDRFSDYLQGLPFHFHYTHYSIRTYLNGLGINPDGKEYTNDQSLKMYHYLIYSQMIKNI